ncbi:MAG: type II toxin-antitoxin system RelE/ParE family toxin [Polyangiaceae bacterium]
MKIVFHSEALREPREAQGWYAKQGTHEYAERLVELVGAKVEEIAAAPESFPVDAQRPWARRARILKSPYTLIFTVHEGTAVVLAVAHGKRRPGYWARR